MFGLGAGELFLILLIALFLLGPKKLPQAAKGLGAMLREFQKAKDQVLNEIHRPEDPPQSMTKVDQNSSDQNALGASPSSHTPANPHASLGDEEEFMTKKPESEKKSST